MTSLATDVFFYVTPLGDLDWFSLALGKQRSNPVKASQARLAHRA